MCLRDESGGSSAIRAKATWIAFGALLVMAVLAGCSGSELQPLSPNSPSSGGAGSVASLTPTGSASTGSAGLIAPKVYPPAAGAYLGVFSPPVPFKGSSVDSFTALTGKGVSIVMWYQPWAAGNRSLFDAATCWRVLKGGSVPMITWEPWDPGTNSAALKNPSQQPSYSLRTIIDGKHDAYIRSWARQIRDFGGPIMLRPMHEMNGKWYPWGGTVNGNQPSDFVPAWRHIVDLFAAEGADNVTWVWSVNALSLPKSAENTWSAYYPGDGYVDWVGTSGFNWGNTAGQHSWETFSKQFDPVLGFLSGLPKPVCITETGCTEVGGDKAAWLLDAYAKIQSRPEIKGVVYYNARDKGIHGVQDWRVNTSAASLSAFQQAIAPPYFLATPPVAVSEWMASLTPAQRAKLDALKPIY